MKIIDLLNKIANGEEVPKRIKLDDCVYIWNNSQKDYVCEQTHNSLEYIIGDYIFNNLNLKVEILEEEKKIPEKIPLSSYHNSTDDIKEKVLINKINEIINYLKSKGDE